MSAVREGDSLKKDLKQQHTVQNTAFRLALDSAEKTQLEKENKSKLYINEYMVLRKYMHSVSNMLSGFYLEKPVWWWTTWK